MKFKIWINSQKLLEQDWQLATSRSLQTDSQTSTKISDFRWGVEKHIEAQFVDFDFRLSFELSVLYSRFKELRKKVPIIWPYTVLSLNQGHSPSHPWKESPDGNQCDCDESILWLSTSNTFQAPKINRRVEPFSLLSFPAKMAEKWKRFLAWTLENENFLTFPFSPST